MRAESMMDAEPVTLSPDEFEQEVERLLWTSGLDLKDFRAQRREKLTGPYGVYEIDVTARFEALGADFLVLVECKHHKRKVERELVQVLHDRIGAVGAHKGIMFSTAGFQ